MKTKIPPAVFLFAGVAVLGWMLYRRRQSSDAAAANVSYGGWPIGAVPASFSYLTSAAPTPTDQPIGALGPADSMALQLLQVLTTRLAGGGNGAVSTGGGTVAVAGGSGGGGGGLETPFLPSGFTAAQVAAAAAKYASGRSYAGAGYVPHMVVQEGHTEVRNGVKGVYIKYETPGHGSSTEWTPLQ